MLKAVILAAGLGTRLVPYSKEMPKEMLPILVRERGELVLKPILQEVFEQLYDAGVREFCFVVGRGKRAVEDHFTPDWNYVNMLEKRGKRKQAEMLRRFYEKVERTTIFWVNQPVPKGTGDAVYKAKSFVGDDFFFVAAGDNLFLGENVPLKLLDIYRKYSSPVLTVKRVDDPRRYGVVEGDSVGERTFRVRRIVEKPKGEPPSNLANTSLYLFPPDIIEAIERTEPSPERGEIEITESIQLLLDSGRVFYAYEPEALWVDVGTPRTYLEALLCSLKNSLEESRVSATELASLLGLVRRLM